jgi:hypothetical protein
MYRPWHHRLCAVWVAALRGQLERCEAFTYVKLLALADSLCYSTPGRVTALLILRCLRLQPTPASVLTLEYLIW